MRVSSALKIVAVLIVLGLLAGGGAVWFAWQQADAPIPDAATSAAVEAPPIADHPPPGHAGSVLPPPATPPSDARQAAMIARGRYLVAAADCMPCHSVSGAAPFAGGRPLATPFGVMFSPNITPSKRYGIGRYTDADFWRVLHDGIAPTHSPSLFPNYLLPVMPYTAYSKLSYPDVMAIKAYLDSLPPVEQPHRKSQIPFPFNQSAGLFVWRVLFFRHEPVEDRPEWSASVRHGAWLAQALAHCSDCHTPRNIAMASESDKLFAGGHIPAQSWYASNISNATSDGIGGWSDAALVQFLHGEGDMTQGAPFGPMKEVVEESLSRLPASDIADIVAYLRTTAPQNGAPAAPADTATLAEGARVYADSCARCHGKNGEGAAGNFPNLAHNQAIWEGAPDDIIAMILGGFRPWHPHQAAMPVFEGVLNDHQIAAVANYVRTAWGNQGRADADANAVGRLRATMDQEIALNTGTMRVRLTDASGTRSASVINGLFDFLGDRRNCRLDTTFTVAKAPADPLHIAGTCTDDGFALDGWLTQGGATRQVRFALRDDYSPAGHLVGVTLEGPTGAAGAQLSAHIAVVTPNY